MSAASDRVTKTALMVSRFPDIAALFESPAVYGRNAFGRLRQAESIGRPLGNKAFLD